MVKDALPDNNGLIPSTKKALIETSSLISRGLDLAKNITAFLSSGKRESLKMYLKEIRGIPLLTAEEEIRLARRVRKGDEDARNKMFRSNLRLVIKIAIKYIHSGIPLLYLIEEGNLGLMRAVEQFDPRKGYRFSTYAVGWIKESITRFISEQGKIMRIPVHSAKNQREPLISLGRIDTIITNKPPAPVIAFFKLLKDLIITEEDCGTLNTIRGKIRNGFICESEHGICLKCYGRYDLVGKLAYIGENVGGQIAYAWGEIEIDRRLRNLLEARIPSSPAILCGIDGIAKITQENTGWREIIVTSNIFRGGIEARYRVSGDKEIKVRNEEKVLAGQVLTDGEINPQDVIRTRGDKEFLEYMTSEIIPYLSKFNFNDKRMVELPLRKMTKVEIEDPGDTNFAYSQTVNKFEFYRENVLAIKKGKRPAIGIPVFIGMRL